MATPSKKKAAAKRTPARVQTPAKKTPPTAKTNSKGAKEPDNAQKKQKLLDAINKNLNDLNSLTKPPGATSLHRPYRLVAMGVPFIAREQEQPIDWNSFTPLNPFPEQQNTRAQNTDNTTSAFSFKEEDRKPPINGIGGLLRGCHEEADNTQTLLIDLASKLDSFRPVPENDAKGNNPPAFPGTVQYTLDLYNKQCSNNDRLRYLLKHLDTIL